MVVSGTERATPCLELPRDGTGLATSDAAMGRLADLLPAFLDERLAEAGADRLIVALDGTADSTVAATMAVDAVGADAVTGVITPAQFSDEAPARDAEAVASMLGIEYRRLQLQPLLVEFQRIVGTEGGPVEDLVAMENAVARLRTACLYYLANTTNALVVGTVTRTERLLGLVAKHGDTAVDLALLGDLYRSEVRALAEYLDVPDAFVGDAQGQTSRTVPTDAADLDVDLATLDGILRRTIDCGESDEAVAAALGVPPAIVDRVRTWCERCQHKRRRPPTPSTVE